MNLSPWQQGPMGSHTGCPPPATKGANSPMPNLPWGAFGRPASPLKNPRMGAGGTWPPNPPQQQQQQPQASAQQQQQQQHQKQKAALLNGSWEEQPPLVARCVSSDGLNGGVVYAARSYQSIASFVECDVFDDEASSHHSPSASSGSPQVTSWQTPATSSGSPGATSWQTPAASSASLAPVADGSFLSIPGPESLSSFIESQALGEDTHGRHLLPARARQEDLPAVVAQTVLGPAGPTLTIPVARARPAHEGASSPPSIEVNGEEFDVDDQSSLGSSDFASYNSDGSDDEDELKVVQVPSSLISPDRRSSWKECAGRSRGSLSYHLGDLTRSIMRSVTRPREDTSAFANLIPIDRQGGPCSPCTSFAAEQQLPHAGESVFLHVHRGAVLGEGQYGIVWRARSQESDQWFAVKSLKGQSQSGCLAAREAELAKRIKQEQHPCLVRLFHVHCLEAGALGALVMEYCQGGDLQGRIRDGRAEAKLKGRAYRPPPLARSWIAQVFLGLEFMHLRMEFLFRDLKPGNVLVAASGRAKLTDFGLGRCGLTSAAGAWSFGFPCGTLGYIAPEILEQEAHDHCADLYSFGVLIWVLLTGGITNRDDPQPPVNGVDYEWELLAQCLEDPVSHSAQQIPEAWQELVATLISLEPGARPQHCEIRASPPMAELPMPSHAAPRSELEGWLQSVRGDATWK